MLNFETERKEFLMAVGNLDIVGKQDLGFPILFTYSLSCTFMV